MTRTCSLCGARAARAAVRTFLGTLTESKRGMTETEPNRQALEEELARLRERIKQLESQLGGHDDLTDRRTEAEIVMDRAEERAAREVASRPRRDNSREAIAVFRSNMRC